MCDKKVRYSDAKMNELHVFPQTQSFTVRRHIDEHEEMTRGSSARADPQGHVLDQKRVGDAQILP